jgi:hypothetical protein
MLSKDYIIGLTDGEGTFLVYIWKREKVTQNPRVECYYAIKMREDELPLLKEVKKFFGCGNIYFQKEYRKNQRDNYRFQIRKIDELNKKVIPLFKKNPLHSQKRKDFEIFCKVLNIVNKKGHLNQKGLEKIKKLKQEMHK